MMPGQIPDPSLTAGALPGLGPLTGLPGTALTAEELKCADIRNIGAMISPLHFLEVKLGKRPQPVKSEDSSDDMRKVQRREKNRIAAQKSRLRQTQKADTLHLESEDLERQNAALRREIKQLTEEMKHFTSMLSSHEPLCSILTSPPPPPEVLYATHSFHQPHISSPRFQH